MAFSWDDCKRPILALAPMAGYTDTAYRQLIKIIEPRVICFTEFTSADGIVYDSENTLKQLDFNPSEERPLVAQIFGKKPEHFTKAAQRIEAMGIDALDINMGCPAKKVVSSDHGSALLKNPCRAIEIVEATVKGTSLPVSFKTRLGVNEVSLQAIIDFCKNLENAGAKLITIHGRTAKQMYTGTANWDPIYEIKRHVKVPVLGNGDVKSASDAIEKLKNLDGVMVGRATMGNPWIMKEIASAFFQEEYTPPKTFAEKLPFILKHAELNVETKGEKRGILEMRKHFISHLKGFEGAKEMRSNVVKIDSLESAYKILEEVRKISLAEVSTTQITDSI